MNAFERVRVKERDARACPLDSANGFSRQMLLRVALPYVFQFHPSFDRRVYQHQGTRRASFNTSAQPRKHLPSGESSGCAAHTGDECVMF